MLTRPISAQTRIYDRSSSVVFLKTREAFGGLSNMAAGFPLHVQGSRIYTSEALYQACRFPHLPEIQRLIAVPSARKTDSHAHAVEDGESSSPFLAGISRMSADRPAVAMTESVSTVAPSSMMRRVAVMRPLTTDPG